MDDKPLKRRILIGVTGASGSVYAERLIEVLKPKVDRIYLVVTGPGRQVIDHELRSNEIGFSLVEAAQGRLRAEDRQVIRLLKEDDLFAPVASGSSAPTEMIVAPCSMGTLARIRHGISSNLLERAADVCLKQGRPLVLLPRETPLSAVHLENMLALTRLGVHMVPAMPAFYQKPKGLEDLIDFLVGRMLEVLAIDHTLYPPWNSRMR